MLGGVLALAAGTVLLAFHKRLRALNESLTERKAIVVLSTYVVPIAFIVVGAIALIEAVR